MSIHDDNFKHNFTSKRVAKDFLRHNLPKKVLSRVNVESVNIEPTEFIPSQYRGKRSADVLYSLRDKSGKKVYAFLHLEAQSTHDERMALRIFEYHGAIARAHIGQGNDKVPLILTFVLYHGKKKWTSAQSIAELFDDFELYVDVSLKSPFLLSLNERRLKELKKQGASAAPQLIMRGQAEGDYCEILEELYPLMRRHHQINEENINYMVSHERHGALAFLEKFSKFDPATANDYKTMFELAIQRERKKILRLGITQGKREGIKEGKIAIAKRMLTSGESKEKIYAYTGFSIQEIEALD